MLTGHSTIDKQHDEIVRLITTFREHVLRDELESRQLREFLDDIHDYAMNHFTTEESFMVRIRYPHYDAHRDEHLIFWGRLIEMMERCEEGDFNPACGDLIYAGVSDWLRDHIHGVDKQLAEWLQRLPPDPPRSRPGPSEEGT